MVQLLILMLLAVVSFEIFVELFWVVLLVTLAECPFLKQRLWV